MKASKGERSEMQSVVPFSANRLRVPWITEEESMPMSMPKTGNIYVVSSMILLADDNLSYKTYIFG